MTCYLRATLHMPVLDCMTLRCMECGLLPAVHPYTTFWCKAQVVTSKVTMVKVKGYNRV